MPNREIPETAGVLQTQPSVAVPRNHVTAGARESYQTSVKLSSLIEASGGQTRGGLTEGQGRRGFVAHRRLSGTVQQGARGRLNGVAGDLGRGVGSLHTQNIEFEMGQAGVRYRTNTNLEVRASPEATSRAKYMPGGT